MPGHRSLALRSERPRAGGPLSPSHGVTPAKILSRLAGDGPTITVPVCLHSARTVILRQVPAAAGLGSAGPVTAARAWLGGGRRNLLECGPAAGRGAARSDSLHWHSRLEGAAKALPSPKIGPGHPTTRLRSASASVLRVTESAVTQRSAGPGFQVKFKSRFTGAAQGHRPSLTNAVPSATIHGSPSRGCQPRRSDSAREARSRCQNGHRRVALPGWPDLDQVTSLSRSSEP